MALPVSSSARLSVADLAKCYTKYAQSFLSFPVVLVAVLTKLNRQLQCWVAQSTRAPRERWAARDSSWHSKLVQGVIAIGGGKEKVRLNVANIFINKHGRSLTDLLVQRYTEGKLFTEVKLERSWMPIGNAVLSTNTALLTTLLCHCGSVIISGIALENWNMYFLIGGKISCLKGRKRLWNMILFFVLIPWGSWLPSSSYMHHEQSIWNITILNRADVTFTDLKT